MTIKGLSPENQSSHFWYVSRSSVLLSLQFLGLFRIVIAFGKVRLAGWRG
jgi:hypothetical protein